MKRNAWDVLIKIFMYVYSLFVIFPVVWIIYTSLKTNKEFAAHPWGLFEVPQFINYSNAWEKVNFSIYTFNSLTITAFAVVVIAIIAIMATYVLVSIKFKWNRIFIMLFIGGLYIPQVLTMPSQFLLLKELQMLDNRFGLSLMYIAYSLPFSIYLLTGFLSGIEKELEEAARIDGCGYNATFWKIIMPISKNGLFTVSLFNMLWIWNDFMLGLTFIMSAEKRTLSMGIVALLASFKLRADWVTLFAGLNLLIIPIIIIYVIFQRSLVEGMTTGAIKG